MKRLILYILFFSPIRLQAQTEASWSDLILRVPTDDQTAILGLSQVSKSLNLLPGTQNEVSILQNGNDNTFVITTFGQGPSLSTVQQGNGNMIDLNLSGNGNLGLYQLGDGNLLRMNNNVDQANLEILQTGNFNGFTSSGVIPSTVQPLKIEQSGGMQISITHTY